METPKENPLSGIWVLDQCEGKRALGEEEGEDEASDEDQPRRRRSTSYLPGETSGSVGGSSCTVASASDSHQSGDLQAEAPSGHRGQTPASHRQAPQQQGVSSRCESTESLLDPEETSGEEGSQQEALEPLDFCPLVEGSSAEWIPAGPLSNYRPQLDGYRPQ